MSSPFSQTTRSLEADTLRGALFAWLPAALVLAAWGTWFVSGQVTETAVSQQAQVDTALQGPAGGVVVAGFAPAAALGRIRAGQTARLRPGDGHADVNARVLHVADRVRDGQVRVELELLSALPEAWHPGVAEVAVGQVTPAVLLARAIGWPVQAPGEH